MMTVAQFLSYFYRALAQQQLAAARVQPSCVMSGVGLGVVHVVLIGSRHGDSTR
jgi:hypothetical protein